MPWLVEVQVSLERGRSSFLASELCLLARPSELSAARRYAGEAAVAFGLDADSCYEFVYAVNEAVTNAITYGAPDEQGLITLSVVEDGDRLTLAVRDCGTFAMPGLSPTSSERGRGFALMAKLTDEVQLSIKPGSTIVRLSKARV